MIAEETTMDVLASIRNAIEELTKAVRELNPNETLPPDCRQRRCDYYTHYLAYGPADLTHDGYHAATEKCIAIQKEFQEWMELNPNAPHDSPSLAYFNRRASEWEARVRA